MFPEGLINFINLYLDTGIREKIENLCNEYGKDTRYMYYNMLLSNFLNTEFEDQTEYKKINDLPEEEKMLAIKALDYNLGMGEGNGNEYLLKVYLDKIQQCTKNSQTEIYPFS